MLNNYFGGTDEALKLKGIVRIFVNLRLNLQRPISDPIDLKRVISPRVQNKIKQIKYDQCNFSLLCQNFPTYKFTTEKWKNNSTLKFG